MCRAKRSGIYFFFQRGETVSWAEGVADRIVRVGTHDRDGNFRKRIRQHYGPDIRLGGNKNGSVFRKHLGGALMRKNDADDPRLPGWLKQMGPSDPQIEEDVSRLLREDFTYSCIRVDTPEERLSLESGLIALVAQRRLEDPSPDWLGHQAAAPKIRRSGLWNTQRIDAEPLTEPQLGRMERLVSQSIAEQK